MKKRDDKMKRPDVAVTKFLDGYNCAQAVFYAFCDDLQIDKDTALRIACGFGAGMGRKEEVCGAVSGGIMVLGLKYGRGENEDRSFTEQTYLKTRELMDRFAEKYGTFICRELLEGCELLTPEGQKAFMEKDFKNQVCKQCVRSVVEIVDKMLE